MRLRDIVDTWEISRSPGSNWRAIHAGSALFFGACFLTVSLWYLFSDWPTLFRAASFFVLGVLSLVYWRYLLPTAKHISNVRRTLQGKEPR